MVDPERVALSDELVEGLLAPASAVERAALVDSAGLRTPRGLQSLLNSAEQLVPSDPGKGRQLAALAADLADEAGAPAARPRAHYLIAQAHASNAEFDAALALIAQTRGEFEALGEPLEALRTNVGLMHVLRELGRYQEALDAGWAVYRALAGSGDSGDHEASQRLLAMVQESWGSVYEEMGRYDEALHALADAEATYRALGLPGRLGSVSNNRGVALLGLGRAGAALAAFEAAARIFAAAGMSLPRAQALLNSGAAHLLLGSYSQALACLEQARMLFAELDALADTPVVLLDTADAYLALNLYPEAATAYSEASTLLRAAGMPHDQARALWGQGAALVAMGQLDEAEAALCDAAALFRFADNLPLLSGVMLEQVNLMTLRHERAAALATGRAALDMIAGRDFPIQHVYAHLRMADLLLPDLEAVETHLCAASTVADALGLPHLRYRVLQRLGHLRRLQGHPKEARALLEAAVDTIEGLRGTLPFEAVRASFLHDKVAAYEDLVQVHLAASDAEAPLRAFVTAERAKSRSLVELLAGGAASRQLGQGDPAPAGRGADLQADLNAIYLELLGGAPDTGHRANLSALRARAEQLERELSLLRLRAASTTRDDATAGPVSAPSLAHLTAGYALVAYHIVGDEVIAFVCVGSQVRPVRAIGTLSTVQRDLARLNDQLRRFCTGPAFISQHLTLLTQSAQRVLHALYVTLVAPLEPALAELAGAGEPVPRLVVVPHGPLHQIPFHALYDGERYLIDRFEISYAPSATVLALCHTRRARAAGP
ncbi:MAG: CHAT domain-containing protein, partial [Chloroflexales bacterium]|nr:CHAT domain-containing protein [Chloroflexales bacterium]